MWVSPQNATIKEREKIIKLVCESVWESCPERLSSGPSMGQAIHWCESESLEGKSPKDFPHKFFLKEKVENYNSLKASFKVDHFMLQGL